MGLGFAETGGRIGGGGGRGVGGGGPADDARRGEGGFVRVVVLPQAGGRQPAAGRLCHVGPTWQADADWAAWVLTCGECGPNRCLIFFFPALGWWYYVFEN